MSPEEKIEVMATALRFYSKDWWQVIVVVDEKTACRLVHKQVPPDTGFMARNALETVGLLPPPSWDVSIRQNLPIKGVWDYERCGYKTNEDTHFPGNASLCEGRYRLL